METQKQIKANTSVLNEVLTDYGQIDYIFHFLSLNPVFDNILETISVGETITVDDFIIPVTTNKSSISNVPVLYTNVTARENQSIFDIVTRYYGTLDNTLKVLTDNSSVISSINQTIVGLNFNLFNTNSKNEAVKSFDKNNAYLATALRIVTTQKRGRAFNFSFSNAFS